METIVQQQGGRKRTRGAGDALIALAVVVVLLFGTDATPTASTATLDGPTTPILDNFDGRGLEDPLYQWGNWSPTSIDGNGQTLEIIGGGASHNDGDNVEADSYRAADATGALEAYATIGSSAENNSDMFVYINLQQTGTPGWDGYRARWFHWIAVDGLYLEKVVDGVATSMVPPVQLDPASGDTILIRNNGGTIELWHKSAGTWIRRLSAADGSFQGGKIGLGMNDDGGLWDDFGGTGTTTPPPTAPAVPATDFLDQFQRANEDPLSQAGAWSSTPLFGTGETLEVLSSAAGQNEGEVVQVNSFRTDDVVGDAEVHARIANTPNNNQWFYLYLHLQQAGTAGVDGYRANWFHWISTDGLYIQKITNGVATTIAGPLALDPATGDTLLLRRWGLALELWRRNGATWTKLLSTLDGDYTSGRLGLGMDDDDGKWDDFGGGGLTAPPPPPPSSSPPLEQSHGICNGSGVHAHSTSRCLSDPVNTLTGAFINQVEDISTPGTGVSFAWSRSYTSSDMMVGRLGQGWIDTYATSLLVQADGDVTLRGDEGQVVEYTRQADGTFVGAPGSLSTLSATAGGYELVRADQVVYHFDAEGDLASIVDRNGQGLSLGYDAQGRLAQITDAANRETTLAYDASGLVSQVETADGRRVSYGYTGGRLTSVTDVRGKPWTYTYDTGGRLATIGDPLGNTEVANVYDANGRVQSQADALGKTTAFGWDANTEIASVTDANGNVWKHDYEDGVLSKQIDPLNRVTEFGHDSDLNMSEVTSPTGETTTMTYDAKGNILSAIAPASLGGAQKTFLYNPRNDPVRVTDAKGTMTTHTYDASGNTTGVVQAGTQVASYSYDAAGRVVASTDANGKTTAYVYGANGYPTSVADPLGNETTYTYDAAGRVVKRVDPKGNVAGCNCASDFIWTYTYNPAGQLLTETDPLSHTMTNVYDDAGRLTSSTDANSHTTSYTYDDADRVLAETAPDPDGGGPLTAPVTTSTYDSVGNKLTETDRRGNKTSFAYDAANRLSSTTGPDPDGPGALSAPVTSQTYDPNGNLLSTVEPRGNVPGANPDDYRTTSTYDAAGRLLTERRPDPDGVGPQTSPVTTNVYDPVGNLQSVRDGNNHMTTYTYDAAGRILTVTAPDLGVTTYTYDDAGNVLSRKNDNNHVTTTAYDDAGRLVSETSPDPDGPGPLGPAVTSYTYDPNGNRLTLTDPNGNATGTSGDGQTTYAYDRANRLTSVNHSDSTSDVAFTYDNVGNRMSMTDGSGSETRAYDALDRLLSVTRGANTFSYAYDAAGNVTRRSYPGGAISDYAYDPLNRLSSVMSGGQTTSYGYDAASNLTQTTLPAVNGYVESRTYDRAGRLTEVNNQKGASVLARFVATLDAVGNPTQMVRTGALSQTQTYGYDASDRLLSVCFLAGSCPGASDPFIRWTYDGVGNRKTETRPGQATTNYSYDARDRLLSAGSTSYTYDQNGNELSAGSRTFVYDLANRLKTTTQGNTTTTHTYDGDGVRLQASTGSQASKKTNFLWDLNGGLPQLALERDGNNVLLRRYLYGARRISMVSGSDTSYYLTDGLGSVANLTSSSGAAQWTWSYEPFGQVRTETKARGSKPPNFMKFTGEYLDPNGLYHLRVRQYDPAIGRFLRPDPVEPGVGSAPISSYAYAANQPTVMVDPSGEIFESADGGPMMGYFAASLVEWQMPAVRCQSSLCGSRLPKVPLRVHPIPKRYSTWGGTLIHPTSDLPGYPALDFGGRQGTPTVAVEAGHIREFGSAMEGDALYLRGDSGIDYWYGHIRRLVSRGQRVRLGQVIGRTAHHSNGDHLHLGANANIDGEIIGRARRGTDVRTHPTWIMGVAVMQKVSRAPRI